MIKKAAALLEQSEFCVVLTGAGISTPSGIPDFRSSTDGMWEKYDPMEVASQTSFRINPEIFFSWMQPLAKKIFFAKPNPAHLALSELQNKGYIQEIITQNIDSLHQKSGSINVHEIHGTLNSLTCIGCNQQFAADEYIEPYIQGGTIPLCPECGEILKPDVILFGERLPVKTWQAAQNAVDKCDLIIVVGTSLEVMPVSGLPMDAVNNGAKLIIINNDPTYLDSRADVIINDDASKVLPMISNELNKG